MHAADPAHEVSVYSLSTGTGTLRHYFYTSHLEEWVDGCDRLKIKITATTALPFVKRYRDRTSQEGGADAENETCPKSRPRPYSSEGFIDALVEWIVADDQVCLYSPIALLHAFNFATITSP